MVTDPDGEEIALHLGLREFLQIVEHQPTPLIVPLFAELPLPPYPPAVLFTHLARGPSFLLESMEGSPKIARYSYLGTDPELTVSLGDRVRIAGKDPFVSIARNPEGTHPIEQIGSILRRFQYVNIGAPRFFGGLVGYFGYGVVHALHGARLPVRHPDPETPLARFMLATDCLVLDHLARKLFIFASPLIRHDTDPAREYRRCQEKIIERVRGLRSLPDPEPFDPSMVDPDALPACRSNLTREEFCRRVERIQEYIRAGDIFQAVLSRRLDLDFTGDPFSLYRALRAVNPSPYMIYLDFGDLQVAGASPEMLVRVERRQVTTVPIAGTRPRGNTPEEDERLARELLQDEKERAEHTMLLDLARNDVGRVSAFGSVQVGDFMAVEKFSHVQHLVSTVHGTLRDDLDGPDALTACFPAGTVSGAPKLRALQIIDELEPDPRGLYAGAIGWMGFDRNLEFAITIRTITARRGRISIQVGAGIVADSVPEREFEETESKARAMMRACRIAGGHPCGS